MFRASTVLLGIAILLSACAAPREGFIPAQRSNPNFAIVYFYNPSPSPDRPVGNWHVEVDGNFIADLEPGHYTWRELSPGTHNMLAQFAGDEVRQYGLGLDQRREYFATYSPVGPEDVEIDVKDSAVGMAEISSLTPTSLWGSTMTRLENVNRERRGRLDGDGENPIVRRTPRIVWSDIDDLFDHACEIHIVFRFRMDTSGFPEDVIVANAVEMTPDQVEWARDYLDDYRFDAFKENGKRIARQVKFPVALHAPEGYCTK